MSRSRDRRFANLVGRLRPVVALAIVATGPVLGCSDDANPASSGSGGQATGGLDGTALGAAGSGGIVAGTTGGVEVPTSGTNSGGRGAGATGGDATGGDATGGLVTAGTLVTGGIPATGGARDTGGVPALSGGTVPTGGSGESGGVQPSGGTGGTSPLFDCSGIVAAGYELCATTDTSCSAVFSDSAGCTAVCAAAGLACASAAENLDGVCAPDSELPPVDCDSGHQSDYCNCAGRSDGTGGAAGSGGAPATGGVSATGGVPDTGGATSEGDCNNVTDEPVVTVAQDGSGQYSTVQAAVRSISSSNTTPTQIRIAPGTYHEKLSIDRPHLTLCGQTGRTSETILTYGDNANTPDGNGGTIGTSGSASTNISASDVSAQNLTFENSTPLGGSQAVALRVTGSRVQFRNCRFLSYQDTLYVHSGSQYFRDCYVAGNVDFIFGAATAVFDGCTIHNASGGTAVTAPSTEQATPFGLVFLGGELTASESVRSGSVALGRNWRPYGAATYLGTTLGEHISAVGWVQMGDNTLDTARFSEYQTTGPGANPGARAPQSHQLSDAEAAAYTVQNVFGTWTPSFSR